MNGCDLVEYSYIEGSHFQGMGFPLYVLRSFLTSFARPNLLFFLTQEIDGDVKQCRPVVQECLKREGLETIKTLYFQKDPFRIPKLGMDEFDFDLMKHQVEPYTEYHPVRSEDPCYYFMTEILEARTERVQNKEEVGETGSEVDLQDQNMNHKTFQFVPINEGSSSGVSSQANGIGNLISKKSNWFLFQFECGLLMDVGENRLFEAGVFKMT